MTWRATRCQALTGGSQPAGTSGAGGHLGDNGLDQGDSKTAPGGDKSANAFYDALDDRAAVGMYARTPWL